MRRAGSVVGAALVVCIAACGTDATDNVADVDTAIEVVPDALPVDTSEPVDTNPVDTSEPVDTLPVETSEPVDTNTVDTMPVDTSEPVDTLPVDTSEPVDTMPVDTNEAVDTNEPLDTTPADTTEPADTAPSDTTAPEAPPGALTYARVDNIVIVDDLVRVAWHASGDYAIIAGRGGRLALYLPGRALQSLGALGGDLVDLLALPDGDFFALDAGLGLLRIAVDPTIPSASITSTTPLPLGSGRALAPEPGADRVAIAAHGTDSIAYLYTHTPDVGLSPAKAFNASAGISDVMWGAHSLYAQSPNLVTAHGRNGADSKTYVLDSDLVVGNGWSPGFGNAGASAWRPFGAYGLVCGWSSNKLYVFDGDWTMATLPVPTGASPNAVAWKADGTRALVVGRVIGSPPYAVVVEQRAGAATAWQASFIDQSIRDFDEAPWLGNTSSMHLLDVAWRPGTACDEGLIVGTDSGPSFSPTFGMAIRFQDQADPACPPIREP